jgi:hypothetical protein
MTATLIEQLITQHEALIAALDSRNVAQIEQATAKLNDTLAAMRAQDVWRGDSTTRERVNHALKQTDAARIRVNYLSDWTRQRIDSIAELRGGAPAQTYTSPYKIKGNDARA